MSYDINRLYKIEKRGDPTNVPEVTKWEAVLKSKQDNIIQSALYWSQQILKDEEGFDVFTHLLYSDDDKIVLRVMQCLTNFAQNDILVETMQKKGFTRVLTVLQHEQDIDKQTMCLHFLCNVLYVTPSLQDVFIRDGGLSLIIYLLATCKEEQINIAALQIFTNLVASRQNTRDYDIFATEEIFGAFSQVLQQSNLYDIAILQNILTILVTLVQTDYNRSLYKRTNGIPGTVSVLKKHVSLQQIAVNLLSNVFMDHGCATEIVEKGGVPPILACLNSSDIQTLISTLSALSNLALREDIVDVALESMEKYKSFEHVIKLIASSNAEVRNRAVRAVSNFMAHEQAQLLFKETGGIRQLLNIAKNDAAPEETKVRAVTAIFHMTMYNDEMRNYVISTGLEDLLPILTATRQPLSLRREVAKAMINMSLADNEHFSKKSISSLLEIISKGTDVHIQELVSMILENLCSDPVVISQIEMSGGLQASLNFLYNANTPGTQEHSVVLISRFAINSKMRAQYQRNDIGEFLQKMAANCESPVKSAIKLAISNVSMQHYEDDQIPEIPENPYPEFEDCDLESVGENDEEVFFRPENYNTDTESEVELSYSKSDHENYEAHLEEPELKKTVITTANLVGETIVLPINGISPDPAEEEIEDHSISKEYYTVDDEEVITDLPASQSKAKRTTLQTVTSKISKVTHLSAPATALARTFSKSNPEVPELQKTSFPAAPHKKTKSPRNKVKKFLRETVKTQKSTADPERFKLAKMHYKRTKVAQELLNTEGTYVRSLAIAIKKFQNPLLQMTRIKKPLIKEEQIRTIFSSIEIIFGYNMILLETLNQRMARWSTKQIIGDIFVKMADSFKGYTDYINNFDKSQQTLEKVIATTPKIAKWIETTSKSEICKGLSLISYLITPVQRLPRYSLLLRELLASTTENHPDCILIAKAIEKINEVNSYLNDKKKRNGITL